MAPEDDPADDHQPTREEHDAAMPLVPAPTGGPIVPMLPENPSIMDVIAHVAINPHADAEKLKACLAMKRELEADEARRQFNEAKAAWSKVAPDVYKTKSVGFKHKTGGGSTDYKHADLGIEVKILRKSLAEFGFSFDWSTVQKGDRIFVTCELAHAGGHTKTETMEGPEDHSGKKNDIQAIGSGAKYLRRYTLEGVTGIAPIDEDDDGRGAGDPPDKLKAKADWREEYARLIRDDAPGLTEDMITDWCRARHGSAGLARIRENQTWRDLAEARADKMLSDWPGFIAEVTGWQNEKDDENDMDDANAAFGEPDDDR